MYAIYSRYVEDTPPGYTSIVVLLVLLSGFIIISLGVVGLYVGRIFDQVKGRPLFVVDEQIDGDDAARLMDDALERFTFDVEERHWWYRGRRAVLEAVLDGLGPLRGRAARRGSSTPAAARGATWSSSRGAAR